MSTSPANTDASQPTQLQVFISYSRRDSELATQLHDDLEREGMDAWLDNSDISAGYEWDNSIEDAIDNCDYFVLLISESSMASENVLDEVNFARNLDKRIIPVLKEQCTIPYRLQRLQHIDLEENYEHGFQHLLATLHGRKTPKINPLFNEPADQHLTNDELRHLLKRKQTLFYGGLLITAVASFLLLSSTTNILSALGLSALLAALLFLLLETGSPAGKQLSAMQRKQMTGYRAFFLPSRLSKND